MAWIAIGTTLPTWGQPLIDILCSWRQTGFHSFCLAYFLYLAPRKQTFNPCCMLIEHAGFFRTTRLTHDRKQPAGNFFLVNLFGSLKPIGRLFKIAVNDEWTAVQTRLCLRDATILSNGKKRANLHSLKKGRLHFCTTKIFSDLAKKILRTRWWKPLSSCVYVKIRTDAAAQSAAWMFSSIALWTGALNVSKKFEDHG